MSSLVRLGLIDLTSSGARGRSTGPLSTESRCMIMVPLLFRLGRRGLVGTGAWMWSTDDPDDESER